MELPERIGIVVLKARDIQAMISFYRDKLGLPLATTSSEGSDAPIVSYARFETDGAAIELFAEKEADSASIPMPRKNSITIAFEVRDIHSVYDELVRRGVEFRKGIGEMEWGWYVNFSDPEGNKLQLYQSRSPSG